MIILNKKQKRVISLEKKEQIKSNTELFLKSQVTRTKINQKINFPWIGQLVETKVIAGV